MSYNIHEAYCLDSQRTQLFWNDHFEGDSVKDLWRTSGTATVIDAQTGGIVRLTTGAVTGNTAYIDWGDIRSLLASKRVTLEVIVRLTQTSNVEVWIALWYDATHFIRFRYDSSAGANWLIETDDGTGPTSVDSGIAADTDEHVFRVELIPVDEAHFYLDLPTECANSPISLDIPTEHLQPFVYVETLADAAKSVDVNYVAVRQDI